MYERIPLPLYMKHIAPDKWKHFFVGIILGGVIQIFINLFLPKELLLSAVLSFLLLVTGNYGFELFSKFTGIGHYDFLDAVAGTIGGVLGMAAVLMFLL